MARKPLSQKQKNLDTDIWLIGLITAGVFLCYLMLGNMINEFVRNGNNSILLRLFVSAGIQFGIAGLAITIVCLIRKEKFQKFGLKSKGTLTSIAGAIVSFLPYIIYIITSGQFNGYRPLDVFVMNDVLHSNIWICIIGVLTITVVWGFFEGFNYVVINDKLNQRYPAKNMWLNVGAIVCAIACILFHPISFTTLGMIECITTFIGIYGMLIAKSRTGNAWGCIFVFCFIWNAI